MDVNKEQVVAQTMEWIKNVVIGCNFCPFAAKAVMQESIRFVVLDEATLQSSLERFAQEIAFLDQSKTVETTLMIFPNHFADFEAYLDLVELAEDLVDDQGYSGVYQVASFHPKYCFAGSHDQDPANYTNRSIYPMLHLLREESVTAAVEHHPNPEGIPERNIAFAQEKGLAYMRLLMERCSLMG
jgi:uncharacterized protein